MSSSTRDRGNLAPPGPKAAPGAESAPVLAPVGAPDPYSNWLDRTQRARARHSAITQNLYSWANYKNWADRMRTSWDDEKK